MATTEPGERTARGIGAGPPKLTPTARQSPGVDLRGRSRARSRHLGRVGRLGLPDSS
jgi:hypothetical protein